MTPTQTLDTIAAKAPPICVCNKLESMSLLQIYPLQIEGGPVAIGTLPFVIGRDDSCELSIHDASVSRRHSVIEKTAIGFSIRDLGSTNGTYIGDREVAEHALNAGDQIRMGNRIFKVLTSNHFEFQYHEAVYSMMTRDGLTGVWNKRYFMDSLERAMKRSQRKQHTLALAIVDIDFFKKVNDTHGHLAGDDVLTQMCERIQLELRCEEVFARFGGEEFAMILNETNLDEAMTVAERCRCAVERHPFATLSGPIYVTISIGVSVNESDAPLTPVSFIDQADAALYAAKHAGRNRVSHH